MSARKAAPKIALAPALIAAAVLLTYVAGRAWPLRGEDFLYYYCAGSVAAAGRSPYDPAPYQACIADVLGRPNPNASKGSGSAYPPPAVQAFRRLAAAPYAEAFALWNAALLAASLWLLWRLRERPADPLLLVTWPGFALCWAYHKLTLILFALLLEALRLVAAGDDDEGGALLGLLCLQPHWLAAGGLYLAALRRWRALAAAALAALALLVFSYHPGWLSSWLASATSHANNLIGYDNQSLFMALYKPSNGWPFSWNWFLVARYATSLALAAWAWRSARGTGGLPLFLGLILVAQPYSHASDTLWAFPLLLAVRDRLAARWGAAAADAAALVGNALLWLAFAGCAPGHERLIIENREGYLGCGLVVLWLASVWAARRARSGSAR